MIILDTRLIASPLTAGPHSASWYHIVKRKRSIYLSEEMDREIRILAAKTDKHYSDVVKEALTIYMDKARKKEK
jgi:hypothetical protein